MIDILAVGVHPDDIEAGCSGFLAKAKSQGYKIGMLVLTKGGASPDGTTEIREVEALNASKYLGAEYFEILDFEDGKVEFSKNEASISVVERIIKLKPKLVLTMWHEDHHPDHRATSEIVKNSVYLCGTAAYYSPDYKGPNQILYYILGFKNMVMPNILIDVTDTFDIKRKAFATHVSQKKFLPLIEMFCKAAGSLNGTKYAEGFKSEYPIKLSDLNGLI